MLQDFTLDLFDRNTKFHKFLKIQIIKSNGAPKIFDVPLNKEKVLRNNSIFTTFPF